jgi:hypothetical protein
MSLDPSALADPSIQEAALSGGVDVSGGLTAREAILSSKKPGC